MRKRLGTLMINARSETVQEKPTFSDGFLFHRCVIPASMYFEWNANKEKASFTTEDDATLYMAGIFAVRSNQMQFTVLTRDADDIMLPVHDRMPLLVRRDQIGDWLFDINNARKMMAEPQEKLVRKMEYEQLSFI